MPALRRSSSATASSLEIFTSYEASSLYMSSTLEASLSSAASESRTPCRRSMWPANFSSTVMRESSTLPRAMKVSEVWRHFLAACSSSRPLRRSMPCTVTGSSSVLSRLESMKRQPSMCCERMRSTTLSHCLRRLMSRCRP